jgi:hypothetical protein
MKTIFLKSVIVILLIVISNNLFAQIEPSDCETNDSIKNTYIESAAQLSVRQLYEVNSPDTILVKLNAENIDTILSVLIAIYNVQNIPERDTIIDIFHISSRGPGINKVYIKVDTTKSWTDNWKNMITFTGDSLMDTIITKYHLTIDSYNAYSGTASFTSDLFLNIETLVDTIEIHPDVIYAGQNQGYLDGSNIYYTTELDTHFVKYEYAWGDCMSGCMCRRFWEFKVYSDCSVEFVKSYGCVIQSISELEVNNNITMYPNPNDGKFKIKGKNIENIEIFNMSGMKINNILPINGQEEIISIKQNGTFLVKILTKEGNVTKKIIIE